MNSSRGSSHSTEISYIHVERRGKRDLSSSRPTMAVQVVRLLDKKSRARTHVTSIRQGENGHQYLNVKAKSGSVYEIDITEATQDQRNVLVKHAAAPSRAIHLWEFALVSAGVDPFTHEPHIIVRAHADKGNPIEKVRLGAYYDLTQTESLQEYMPTTEPVFSVVAIDESEFWSDDALRVTGGVYGMYLYDKSRVFPEPDGTRSYWLDFLYNAAVNPVGDGKKAAPLVPDCLSLEDFEFGNGDNSGIKLSCAEVDAISGMRKFVTPVRDEEGILLGYRYSVGTDATARHEEIAVQLKEHFIANRQYARPLLPTQPVPTKTRGMVAQKPTGKQASSQAVQKPVKTPAKADQKPVRQAATQVTKKAAKTVSPKVAKKQVRHAAPKVTQKTQKSAAPKVGRPVGRPPKKATASKVSKKARR